MKCGACGKVWTPKTTDRLRTIGLRTPTIVCEECYKKGHNPRKRIVRRPCP